MQGLAFELAHRQATVSCSSAIFPEAWNVRIVPPGDKNKKLSLQEKKKKYFLTSSHRQLGQGGPRGNSSLIYTSKFSAECPTSGQQSTQQLLLECPWVLSPLGCLWFLNLEFAVLQPEAKLLEDRRKCVFSSFLSALYTYQLVTSLTFNNRPGSSQSVSQTSSNSSTQELVRETY